METTFDHMETAWKLDGNRRFPARLASVNLFLAAVFAGGYAPGMSVATLQQFGQDLPTWLALVERGESIAITQAGRVVARVLPPEPGTEAKAPSPPTLKWPDFAARRRAIFGEAVWPAGTAQALIDEDRGA